MSYDTSYIGAHRGTIITQAEGAGSNFGWSCTCGRKCNVATLDERSVVTSFARHAHEELEHAAVDLILSNRPKTRAVMFSLEAQGKRLQAEGKTDQGNLLILASSKLNSQLAEAWEEQYNNLEWHPWPDDTAITDHTGMAAEVMAGMYSQDYWMYTHKDGEQWTWETWRHTHRDEEWRVAQGEAPTRGEAQRASWEALVAHQEQLEDEQEEPF